MKHGKFYEKLPKVGNRYYLLSWVNADGDLDSNTSFTSDFNNLKQAFNDAGKFMKEKGIEAAQFIVNDRTTDELADMVEVWL